MLVDDGNDARERKCPYCGLLQWIDPADSATAIRCDNANCGQLATYGSWCNPSKSPNYLSIAETTSTAYTQELIRHSIAYTTTSDGGGLASGTVVSLGDRVLIATTGHSIPDDKNAIGLVTKDKPCTGDRSHWIQRTGKSTTVDVAFIELTAGADQELGVVPLPIDRVIDAGAGSPILKTRVVGYPWESRHDNAESGIREFRLLSYGCEPLHTAAWASLPFSNIDPNTHVLAYYEREDNVDCRGDFIQSSPAPEPHGMSGGGFWQRSAMLDDKQLWQPDALCLAAIQSGFFRKRSYLLGVQIAHWLELIADEYPDLREMLHARFPRIINL